MCKNARVLSALGTAAFRELMNASRTSLQSDYAACCPQVNALLELLQAHPDVF